MKILVQHCALIIVFFFFSFFHKSLDDIDKKVSSTKKVKLVQLDLDSLEVINKLISNTYK